jgi:hypothetical protein
MNNVGWRVSVIAVSASAEAFALQNVASRTSSTSWRSCEAVGKGTSMCLT